MPLSNSGSGEAERVMVVFGATTVKLTGTVNGLLLAPLAVIVSDPL